MKRVEVRQDGNVFYDDATGEVLFTSSVVVADGDIESAKSACHEFEAWCKREGIEPVQGGEDDDEIDKEPKPGLVGLDAHAAMAAELGPALAMASASIRDFRNAEGTYWWADCTMRIEQGRQLARDLKELSNRMDRYLD